MIPVLFRLWTATAISDAGTLTTDPIELQNTAVQPRSLFLTVTSVGGAAAVSVTYAVSADGVTFGAFTDTPVLVADSSTAPTPEGVIEYPLPDLNAPWIKFQVTDLASTGDSLVTAVLHCVEED